MRKQEKPDILLQIDTCLLMLYSHFEGTVAFDTRLTLLLVSSRWVSYTNQVPPPPGGLESCVNGYG